MACADAAAFVSVTMGLLRQLTFFGILRLIDPGLGDGGFQGSLRVSGSGRPDG